MDREYRNHTSDNPADYALLLLGKPRLLVEAKGLAERLDDPRWANQTIAYATAAGVGWVVLTNGAEWRIYNAHAPVPLEQKLFRSINLRKVRDEGDDVAVRVLGLLAKESMRDNRIEELWTAHFVDRQVHEALDSLFSAGGPANAGGPAEELVRLVWSRVKDGKYDAQRLTMEDIQRSLARVQATFEFVMLRDPNGTRTSLGATRAGSVAQSTLEPAPSARPRRVPRRRVSPAERKISLVDLLERGLLSPGATLEAKYAGETHHATVLSGGDVEYAGVAYNSLSTAGGAVKEAVAGRALPASKKSTDGWDFWRIRGYGGELVKLAELRQRAVDR